MLPKSFALSDDEESVRSIPRCEYEAEEGDDGPICLNEYASMYIDLPHLSWHGYSNCPNSLTLTNTGETVSLTGKWKKGRPYVACGPLNGCYLFSQIHFHWPSEHSLNERRYELEMHAVHYKAAYLTEERAMKEADGTVVLVYLFEVGKEQTCMSKLTCLLSMIRNKGNKVELCDSRLSEFIKPFISNYFIYWGSADVAGSKCSLQWLISCCRLCISQSELCELKELFSSGEGEPLKKGMSYSKPVPGNLFLVGCTVNAAFVEGNRSEVKFSEPEESSVVPEKSKSCCLLSKCTKNSSSRMKSNNTPDGSIEKLYLRGSNSECSRDSISGMRNDNKTCNCRKKNCQCQQQSSCTDIRTSSGCLSTICNGLSKQSYQHGSSTNYCETNVDDISKSSDQKGSKTDKSCKDEDGKWSKKILKCLLRKNEIHDCIGSGCENQVCSPECDKNLCVSKQSEQEESKTTGKTGKRKGRDSSKYESSSEEDLHLNDKTKEGNTDSGTKKSRHDGKSKKEKPKEEAKADDEEDAELEPMVKKERSKMGNMFSWAKSKKSVKKEVQQPVETILEKKSKEMGQHGPIILIPATVGENHFTLKSVGTMTNQPPPPNYTRGTDIIGEGSDFSGQGPSISSSEIWKRQKENSPKEKADKIISALECEESEDLELLPNRRTVAEEAVQVQLGSSRPISDKEQSLSSVFATLVKDPSLRKVIVNLSDKGFPVEETTTTMQSITNVLSKIAEDKRVVDLLRNVTGSEKPGTEDKLSAKTSPKSSLEKASRQMAVQTESMSVTADSDKSNKESDSKVLAEKLSTVNDSTVGELSLGKSKRSFIINALTELTKDSSLVAEILKTSKETLLASVMALALKDFTGSEKEMAAVNMLTKASRETCDGTVSANAATQTLSQIIPYKVSKTFSGSNNTPTKANKEISESGTSLKSHKSKTSRKPPEPGVSGNRSKQTSSGGTLTKASKNGSGSIESAQSHNSRSSVAAEVESTKHLGSKESTNTQKRGVKALKDVSLGDKPTQVHSDTSSICLLKEASKNSNILLPDKGAMSLVGILSKISKDASLTKDLANIFGNKAVNADTDPSVCVSGFISKEPSNVSKQDSSSPGADITHKRASKGSCKGSGTKKNREVVDVHKNIPSDHSTAPDLDKTSLANILCAALKEKSSTADLGTSMKIQSRVSVAENPSENTSSRQSFQANVSTRDSSTNRKGSQTFSNSPSRNLMSNQQIMEFTSSKEQVLVEILDNFRTVYPDTAEIVKSISWVDILVTALKDSPPNPISRSPSVTSNTSGREIQENPGQVENSSDKSTNKPNEDNAEISVPEEYSAENPDPKRDTVIEVLIDTLKGPFQRETSSENLQVSDEIDISVVKKLTTLSTADAESSQNETQDVPKKNSLTDVLIEVLEKHPIAAEITMSLKNSSVIKLLEKISREPSLIDNKNDVSDGITDDTKIDFEAEELSDETSEAGKGQSAFTANGGRRVAGIADSEKSANSSINPSDAWESSAEESSNTGRNRRDQERNRVNFETESNHDAVATERPEVEKLHRQEDLNESIKSRRSTDTKRSADDDAPVEMLKKMPEEQEEVETEERTRTMEEEAMTKPKKLDRENENAVYFKARFLMKDNGGVDSSENEASDDAGNSAEVTKAEEAGTSEEKPMYFISEAIDVDPETGKKVLTGRFVTHNKCKTL